MKFANKNAIVTGASTGIGREIAISLAAEGAFVALVARNKEALRETQNIIEERGGKAEIFPTDLSDLGSINTLIGDIKGQFSHVDFLINVAGIWHGQNELYADTDFEKFDQKVVMDTIMVGSVAPALLVQSFIEVMPENSKIINISGTFSEGAKGWLPYYLSKRAIEDLTVGLAEELANKKIQVNCISPSDVATLEYKKYFPQYIDQALEPADIALGVLELCDSSDSGRVIVMEKGKTPHDGFHA